MRRATLESQVTGIQAIHVGLLPFFQICETTEQQKTVTYLPENWTELHLSLLVSHKLPFFTFCSKLVTLVPEELYFQRGYCFQTTNLFTSDSKVIKINILAKRIWSPDSFKKFLLKCFFHKAVFLIIFNCHRKIFLSALSPTSHLQKDFISIL